MQLLELTLVELGELALEKGGMCLPCRAACKRRKRGILRDRHSRKESRDIIGSGAGWVNWDRARRDLRNRLAGNVELGYEDDGCHQCDPAV
jgi:hypothetical protein